MANALQLRRGTTSQHSTFTGLAGEVTVDTDKETVVVHDGSTAGGFPLATSATIATEVAALVDSAPGTLDTLNELAAALGDDPNFATTVTNSIATKMPLAGGTFTGDVSFSTGIDVTGTVVADGAQIDLSGIRQLNAQIATSGSGYGAITCVDPTASNLRGLELEGQLLRFGTNSFTETASIRRMQIADNGDLALYEDTGATAKLEWKSGTEELRFEDSVKATFGADEDLQIYHDGSDSYISGDGTIYLSSSTGNETYAKFVKNGESRLYYDNSYKFRTTSDGVYISGQTTAEGKVTVNGPLDIDEVYEKVATTTSTSGIIDYGTTTYAILYFTQNQTANRTLNIKYVNANLAIGQSLTCTAMMTQGSTAYYLDTIQVDSTTVTPKWSGGSAPTGGNASGIDIYTFTIIKTADATFTVLASQTQFA